MKYETPELTALTPAINAIQSLSKPGSTSFDGQPNNETGAAYEEWED